MKAATIYDICNPVILKEQPRGEPGQNLRQLYKKSVGNFLLKSIILRGCHHPQITKANVEKYREMVRRAMQATRQNWQDCDWITSTFEPLAALLDKVSGRAWQMRTPITMEANINATEVEQVIKATWKDIVRTWQKDRRNPYFPVAAQVILSGDDHMDGANLMNILCGLRSFEYQNITMLFALVRCFLMANPKKLALIRTPYAGICEPMHTSIGWIWHRTAYYDAIFFEHLLTVFYENGDNTEQRQQIVDIMQQLLLFMVVSSREDSVTPNRGIRHPAITCLPKDGNGEPLCRLSRGDWQKKRDLGFGDYVPDTDTTFLTLSMAKKWLDLANKEKLEVDEQLIEQCKQLLAYPYINIIEEYQVGSDYHSNPPTISITKPLDYYGAIPIWFDKTFVKPNGQKWREVLGNEICPGHNVDILEAILVNRRQWCALAPQHLPTVHRLLEFHFRAYNSGNFKNEASLKYYLPEMYVYLTSRMYAAYENLDRKERELFDPENKIPTIRNIAIDYCQKQLIGHTLNPFDAALAVSSLVLLKYPAPEDGIIAKAVQVMVDSLGEGRSGHPFLAYEWNRMRHPTRIIVGSPVATSFFVLQACVLARQFLFVGKS